MKKITTILTYTIFSLTILFSTEKTSFMESESSVDWISKDFSTRITMNINKAGLAMPSGRNLAVSHIKLKTPELIKNPLLYLNVDNTSLLGDFISNNQITLEQITDIIESGKNIPATLTSDAEKMHTTNTIKLTEINKKLIKHKYPYTPEEPLDTVPSRTFTGIIIDARGELPVHGEYTSSETYPAFLPKIWDEKMNLIYEHNMTNREVAIQKGIVHYDYRQKSTNYEEFAGIDPLYIKAYKVYGRNRTDPIIKYTDALKILTVPKNFELLKQGKVTILLDKKNLIYNVEIPEKNPEYYATYKALKQYTYENKVPDVEITDTLTGILFRVDLKFIPDSPELLPEERTRIANIAHLLSRIIKDNEFTILVEGHTADIGKPIGQMNLSIERTRTVMNALINEGIPKELFTYKGYGGTKPIASNQNEEGRAQNRRVDITARPRATYIQRDW